MKKRILFLVLALVLCLGLTAPAFAAKDWGDFEVSNESRLDRANVLYGYNGPGGDIAIPSGVNVIWGHAFEGNTSITSVTIPDSVSEIVGNAFQDCTNLKSVTIPESVTKIKQDTFSGCTSLTEVTIPDSVTLIEYGAFSGCTGLTSITIPSSVTEIDNFAFSDCTGLTSITIPNSVTKIDYAFYGCTGLTSVTIPNSVTDISGAFYGCTSLTSITIPSNVTQIGKEAFENCTNLTSVTIPSNVTEIDWRAFADCIGLTSVTIPNSVTEIDPGAFFNCTNLTDVTIPKGCKVDSSAFEGTPYQAKKDAQRNTIIAVVAVLVVAAVVLLVLKKKGIHPQRRHGENLGPGLHQDAEPERGGQPWTVPDGLSRKHGIDRGDQYRDLSGRAAVGEQGQAKSGDKGGEAKAISSRLQSVPLFPRGKTPGSMADNGTGRPSRSEGSAADLRKDYACFPASVLIARLFLIGEKCHGAPTAWLGAKGTYPICPILRRRYLAPRSFSRCRNKAGADSSGKGDAFLNFFIFFFPSVNRLFRVLWYQPHITDF